MYEAHGGYVQCSKLEFTNNWLQKVASNRVKHNYLPWPSSGSGHTSTGIEAMPQMTTSAG